MYSRATLTLAVLSALALPAQAAPRATLEGNPGLRASSATLLNLERLGHDPALAAIGTPRHIDEQHGVPSFLVATGGAADRARPDATAEEAARQHLSRLAPYYGLDAEDVRDAPLRAINAPDEGGIVAVFRQEVDGVAVFRDEVKVLLGRDLRLLAVSGSIPGRASVATHVFTLGLTDAIAAALGELAGTAVSKGDLRRLGSGEGGYETFQATGASASKLTGDPIRARRVYFRAGEQLLPAYHIELTATDEAPTYVIAADNGRVLLRHDRTAYDSYNYRAWADASGGKQPYDGPQGTIATPYPYTTPGNYFPPFVVTPLVQLQNGPISTNDPWLPPGATTTSGNNVDAFQYTSGFRATTTSANTFDRVFDVNQQPDASTNQTMAAVTQIFYTLNFLHDWYYDAGFNEAAGNAQASNYGRGGLAGDALMAPTQSAISSNASMVTPADGASPTLRSFMWASGRISRVTVNSPAAIAGVKPCAPNLTNPPTTLLTAPVALPFPGTFSATNTTLAVGSSPRWVEIADVSADGRPDLAVANASSNSISIFLSNGSGGFQPQASYATGTGPRMVVTPDLNHDGRPDLVSANFSGSISVRLGTGAGAFGASTLITSASGSNSLAVGRFDADGNDDIVVNNSSASNVSVFLGDGSGGFQPKVLYSMGGTPYNVAVGDLNNDGHADLVAANFGLNTVTVRLGTGLGTFGAAVLDTVGNSPVAVALAELNGDGKLDLVTANNGNNTVSVALGNGLGGFGPAVMYGVPAAPISAITKDFNGDGLIDVLVTSNAAGSVSLLANNGAGVLGTPQTIAVGISPAGVALGDVNGDDQPDILTANSGSASVSVLTGTVTPSASICPPFANTLTGRIALVSAFAGGCSPEVKIPEAQARGAVGVLMEFSSIANYSGTASFAIPAFIVLDADGQAMRSALRTGNSVNASLASKVPLSRDGALDDLVVAHEWGHYLSNRLIGNASGLITNQSRGMGEGWGDFSALLLTVRPEDAAVASNTNWAGTYALASHVLSDSITAQNAFYFGLRRYPYSTDLAKDPLTFGHISDANALPVGAPVQGTGGTNAEVHNTGEVWCTMLWECYASLLRDTGRLSFTQARDRMRRYFVQSLQLTPIDPTFLEARDALLMAAFATDAADYQAFRVAFARRGMGTGAVAPSRSSSNNSGVTQSFTIGGDLSFVAIALDDSVGSCDHDGLLDVGEDGYIALKLRNPLMSSSLGGGTATFTSPSATLQFPLGNTATFPSSNPGDVVTARVRVHRRSDSGGVQMDSVAVQYDDSGWVVTGARSASSADYGNVDESPSTNEGFEERTASLWTDVRADSRSALESPPWSKVQPDAGSFDHAYNIPMVVVGSGLYVKDHSLVSPPLVVGASSFGFTFQTAYAFYPARYQGGVVELSTDGGASWADIGSSMTPGYDSVMSLSGMPLYGRPMFGGTSPGFPGRITETVDLGTSYAGQTVRIRFRAEASNYRAAAGWTIDDINFSGITNTPFTSVVAEVDACQLVAVGDAPPPAALAFALQGANPSRGAPEFRFELPRASSVTISLYDMSGRRLATLAEGTYSAGVHHVSWGRAGTRVDQRPGVYFARMTADGRAFTQRLVMLTD